jgi:hypothetical protein
VRGGGDRLGDVGGRIVGEVLVGVISADPESYLAPRESCLSPPPSQKPPAAPMQEHA